MIDKSDKSDATDLMTSAEVAAYFRRSVATVLRWHKSGKLTAAVELERGASGEYRWARADVEAFRAACAPAARARGGVVRDQMNAAYAAMLRKRAGA